MGRMLGLGGIEEDLLKVEVDELFMGGNDYSYEVFGGLRCMLLIFVRDSSVSLAN